MRPLLTFRQAIEDKTLLGGVLGGQSWHAWRAVLVASMGEKLTEDEREAFTRLTGRAAPPSSRVEELVVVAGRRGGKSRAVAAMATYVAGLCDHSDVLVPGERGLVLCIAPDQRQAKIVLDYVTGIMASSPLLSTLVQDRIADTLRLTNGIDIEVRAASFRRLRGVTCVGIVADECAHWPTDGSQTDAEILNAVRPALATTNGPIFMISTPYARRGELWSLYHRHHGPSGDPLILVAQGTSREFNPTLPESVVQRALERDHAAASAEYLAQFRTDIESFISREAVEACVEVGVRERAPLANVQYHAFVDPSGGSSDSMTLAIAHREGDVAVLDAVRERKPPFSPADVVAEFVAVLKSYRVSKVMGDKYAGEWAREPFREHGIVYDPAVKPKSDLYRDALPIFNSGKARLLDHAKLVNQLCSLERRTARSGKDSIDHAPGAHDDVANAVAGAVVEAAARGGYDQSMSWVRDDKDAPLVWTLADRLHAYAQMHCRWF